MSIMVATGRGANTGILIRDAEAVQKLASVDTVVIDKTGTVTEGRPHVTDIITVHHTNEQDLLSWVAGLEQASEHPLASAVLAAAQARHIQMADAKDFASFPGKGISGVVDGNAIYAGSPDFLVEQGIDLGVLASSIRTLQDASKTVIAVGQNTVMVGLIAVSDPIKPGAAAAIAALKQSGLRTIMASGDSQAVATAVGTAIGLRQDGDESKDEIRGGLSPAQKAALISDLQAAGHCVAMAGDGVNDAPALATADVGIAMGAGADVALETAGITLVKGDLLALIKARKLASAAQRNMKQNLAFAFGYNALGIPLAAGVLYPLTGMLLSPMIAAAAMSLSSVSVIANALRLNWTALDQSQ